MTTYNNCFKNLLLVVLALFNYGKPSQHFLSTPPDTSSEHRDTSTTWARRSWIHSTTLFRNLFVFLRSAYLIPPFVSVTFPLQLLSSHLFLLLLRHFLNVVMSSLFIFCNISRLWLYVIIMSSMSFRVNFIFIVYPKICLYLSKKFLKKCFFLR